MGTRIFKIDGKMSKITEPKVGNPENSISRNWATLSHPWNLTFLENDISKLSSYLYGLKVPKWNCAHILLWKKAKNIRKTPKNTRFTAPWLRTTLLNDPVLSSFLKTCLFLDSLDYCVAMLNAHPRPTLHPSLLHGLLISQWKDLVGQRGFEFLCRQNSVCPL